MTPPAKHGPQSRWWQRGGTRMLVVFGLAMLVLGAVAGRDIGRPSANNHFVHLARSWLDGRLSHPGEPPCWSPTDARTNCGGRRADDWAAVYTLRLRDGDVLRGYPCRTVACAESRRADAARTWWILGRGWTAIPRGRVATTARTWYVSFPPGPAAVMLPLVAVFGLATPDVLVTCIAAALCPLVLLGFLDRWRGSTGRTGSDNGYAAAAWVVGSPACFLGAHGSVWFTAQIFAALFTLLYVAATFERRWVRAGLWLGLAIACRPTLVFGGLLAVIVWWSRGRSGRELLRFAGPLVAIGATLAWHNWARFEDPLEFGHRFLEIRWQPRIQETGMFAWSYLRRNLQCMLTLMPRFTAGPPFVQISIHGVALWLTTPWLLAVGAARRRFEARAGLWMTAAAVSVPSLLYQNSGQLQFTYRFALDWLPFVAVALALGGAFSRRWVRALVVVAAIVQLWGAWEFDQAGFFVRDPFGWPFEDEYRV